QIGGRTQPQVGEPKGLLDLCVVGRWNTRIAVLGDGVSGDVLGHVPVDAGTAGLSPLARTGCGLGRHHVCELTQHVGHLLRVAEREALRHFGIAPARAAAAGTRAGVAGSAPGLVIGIVRHAETEWQVTHNQTSGRIRCGLHCHVSWELPGVNTDNSQVRPEHSPHGGTGTVVAVTGAASGVGRLLVQRLAEPEGSTGPREIVAIDKEFADLRGVTWRSADVCDPARITRLEGGEGVVDAAWCVYAGVSRTCAAQGLAPAWRACMSWCTRPTTALRRPGRPIAVTTTSAPPRPC